MFDSQAAAEKVRDGALPSGWVVFPLKPGPLLGRVLIALLVTAGLGGLTLWFLQSQQAFVPGFIPDTTLTDNAVTIIFYVEAAIFAGVALVGLFALVRSILALIQLQDHFLVITPEGVALATGHTVKGMGFDDVRSARESNGAMTLSAGKRDTLTIYGNNFGDRDEIYTLILDELDPR